MGPDVMSRYAHGPFPATLDAMHIFLYEQSSVEPVRPGCPIQGVLLLVKACPLYGDDAKTQTGPHTGILRGGKGADAFQ